MSKNTRSCLSRNAGRAAVAGMIALAVASISVPITADAAPNCAPRKELLDQLGQKYRETPAAVGLASDGTLVEILTNDESLTWTILISRPNGLSCMVAAGESWTEVHPDSRADLGT